MTRSWVFTLTNANQWYNLWTDLILPLITDPTFGNSNYVPNTVKEFKYQNLTAGSLLELSDDKNGGVTMSGWSWDVSRSVNTNLSAMNFRTDTASAQVAVRVAA